MCGGERSATPSRRLAPNARSSNPLLERIGAQQLIACHTADGRTRGLVRDALNLSVSTRPDPTRAIAKLQRGSRP